MIDHRLIGTWKSDRRRTAREIAARRDIPARKREKLLRLFGKLELRYTKTHCYSRLGEYASASRYKVVAKDASSVAIIGTSPIAGKRILHIHFEGDHYWITLGSGRMREFFKRVGPRKKS